ncbi:hypothetical protein [Ruegeria arenilitoris]|nr:hypothetical protein [Ruegeria arenilitoris]
MTTTRKSGDRAVPAIGDVWWPSLCYHAGTECYARVLTDVRRGRNT